MPSWVEAGYQEYAKRLPSNFIRLVEIPLIKRPSSDCTRQIKQEGKLMLAAIPKDNFVIALDVQGEQWSTETLAAHLQKWQDTAQALSLLIGGPEGLTMECLAQADKKWSLSSLTFPHPLVRIIVAEQLYRSWSIINHHPYHRN